MDASFGLVAYDASDDEAQTSSGPSDNGGGGACCTHEAVTTTIDARAPPPGVVLLTEPANGNASTPLDVAEEESPPEEADTEAALEAEARALQALEELLLPDIWNPPEGACDPALQVDLPCHVGTAFGRLTCINTQARVVELLHKQQLSGKRISTEIRKNRDYRNPYFLEKMVSFYGVDPTGSAFPPEVFDPHALPPEDSAQALLNEFQAWQAKRREERERTQRIEFVNPAKASRGRERVASSHAKQLQEARDKAAALAAKLAAQRR